MTKELLSRMTVNDAICAFPGSVAVFQQFGIDACCGGALPIAEAAQRHGVEPTVLLAQLARFVPQTA